MPPARTKRKTYSYGTCPPNIIRAAVHCQCPNGYRMELPPSGKDFATLLAAVNQGIDSHLEAVTGMTELAPDASILGTRRRFIFTPDAMAVICRRLAESSDDNAASFRISILSTLDIEEV